MKTHLHSSIINDIKNIKVERAKVNQRPKKVNAELDNKVDDLLSMLNDNPEILNKSRDEQQAIALAHFNKSDKIAIGK